MVPALPQSNPADNATSDHKVRKNTWIPRCSLWGPLALALSLSAVGCAAEAPDSTVEARVTIGSVIHWTNDNGDEALDQPVLGQMFHLIRQPRRCRSGEN